jgi:hypothetical protein
LISSNDQFKFIERLESANRVFVQRENAF